MRHRNWKGNSKEDYCNDCGRDYAGGDGNGKVTAIKTQGQRRGGCGNDYDSDYASGHGSGGIGGPEVSTPAAGMGGMGVRRDAVKALVLHRRCFYWRVVARSLCFDSYSATARETYDAGELPLTQLENNMYDQHAYAIQRMLDDFDEDARHYEDYVTVAQYDSDPYESLPSQGGLRARGLSM